MGVTALVVRCAFCGEGERAAGVLCARCEWENEMWLEYAAEGAEERRRRSDGGALSPLDGAGAMSGGGRIATYTGRHTSDSACAISRMSPAQRTILFHALTTGTIRPDAPVRVEAQALASLVRKGLLRPAEGSDERFCYVPTQLARAEWWSATRGSGGAG